MNFVLCFISLFCFSFNLQAKEVTLIETDISQKISAKPVLDSKDKADVVKPDRALQLMKDFIEEENKRLKEIKILNLDLERANLELKKKEVEVKIADLTKNNATPMSFVTTGAQDSRSMLFKYEALFIKDGSISALLNINGSRVQVKQGEKIKPNILVKKISSDAVILEYSDGLLQTVNFGA